MKIAQIAPLFESVPPQFYGGTERVVSYLTEELVQRGHEVTLFASGDSRTQAKLNFPIPHALRLDKKSRDHLVYYIRHLENVYKDSTQFDIIHSHIDYLPYSFFRRSKVPNVTTLHGRLDLAELLPLYQDFRDLPYVSISFAQRKPLPMVNWVGNVYHGLPKDLFSFHSKEGRYLAFLGRICPEKKVDRAIQIAKEAGMPLKIAAKVDPVDQTYFETTIKPLLDHPLIDYIGEIGDEEKNDFLGKAYALLFPIDWPEPFGMVLIEAWACGTPVLAYRRGSVPELVKSGKTGFIYADIHEAVRALEKIATLDRRLCRAYFEKYFSVKRMVDQYLKLYESLTYRPRLNKPILKIA